MNGEVTEVETQMAGGGAVSAWELRLLALVLAVFAIVLATVAWHTGVTVDEPAHLLLGIVLRSGNPPTCWAANGYFASGHGDFSVALDQNREYFYILFSTYGGDVTSQGVAIARMPFASRRNPVGAVWKYYGGSWSEPGIAGRVSTVFPAIVGWEAADTDAFWGPSIHWNTYLQRYVVLMNRSCCWPDWPQEGVYISMNADLSDPSGWTSPHRIIEGGDWYPWVKGTGAKETSAVAGQRVRLFMRSSSEWRIVFSLEPQTSAQWNQIGSSVVWTRVENSSDARPPR